MRFVLLFLVSNFCLPSFASPTLPPTLLPLIHKLYLEQGREFTLQQTETQLLENQFLLWQAKRFNPSILDRQSSVGFSTEYHIDKFLAAALLDWFTELKKIKKQSNPLPIDSSQIKALLGTYPADGQYTTEQLLKWKQIKLTNSSAFSLEQVMLSQSMQNRFKLHQGDIKLLRAIVEQRLYQQALFSQARAHLKQHNLNLSQLRQVVAGELLRPSMLAYLGVKEEMHGATSEYVEALRAEIPMQAVASYYARHKDRFRYIQQVDAIAAKFKSKRDAEQFSAYTKANSWQKAIDKFSPSLVWKSVPKPLTRQSEPKWETQLAFSNKHGQMTHSIRTPTGQWLVLFSTSPVYGYYDINSETVRYQAMLALTQSFAKSKFEQDYQQWKRTNNGTIL
ncbi:peptidyl-prolyl cis-trans isomerase [Pseudoalteromonas peptidolytica]|uniref:peptidyl-prolyl cis-trans isomerase n=1 Tax=Pseudoalteromonas peptidolytica TaxID=61150 RepID=UPI00298E23E1|nr:peptidyl-prolyl cis-trans isomerase [Pseudoalteromonas peptidolytica]MDW7549789.1 peptidyl-prolyl cis-trans isomerase [Pseudoalteromonas peptidolytica]